MVQLFGKGCWKSVLCRNMKKFLTVWLKSFHIWCNPVLKTDTTALKSVKRWANTDKSQGDQILRYWVAALKVFEICWYQHSMQFLTCNISNYMSDQKWFLQYLCSGYQIYFDQLLRFQEISVTESQGQKSALNSMVKPFGPTDCLTWLK